MGFCKLTLWTLALLLSLQGVSGAVVSGNLYDSGFNLLGDVLVEITTNPVQSYVSKDGFYTFSITDGKYQLTAYYTDVNDTTYYTTKEVIAIGVGMFKVDLVLDTVYNGSPIVIPEGPVRREFSFGFFGYIALAMLFAGVAAGVFIRSRKQEEPSEIDTGLNELVLIIKKAGGRTTQKELRKQLPMLSESKISLMVSELEEKGRVQKLKKGRGNIIVLKNGKN
jgi:uncharacterized membrane protein